MTPARNGVEADPRDGVAGLPGTPTIASLSDVHGHLDRCRSALVAVGDHPDLDPLVEPDADGRLHWAGGDYVLVFNGDLVDRGPDSRAVLDLVDRLRKEAPDRRVRYHLGNHENGLLYPTPPDVDRRFGQRVTDDERRRFYGWLLDGDVTAAYQGYRYTYVHAGAVDGVEAAALNDELRRVAATAIEAVGTDADAEVHRRVFETHDDLLGYGSSGDGRGPDAGPLWLDFSHLPADAPPQVVGHTPQDAPRVKGNVVCEDVVLRNLDSPGGEAVLLETPDGLDALVREADGGVSHRRLSGDGPGPDGR